ncbi:MAG: DEAD/DEAH box helicase [Planctomycetes bacterium]|nr:DEAD/DEAH box helicase [Planctomycetota bacterium]
MIAPLGEKPVIVQGDRTILLHVGSPLYEPARDAICRFAELESAPEHVHCFRITPLSLWNAAALGLTPSDVKIDLGRYSRYRLPENVLRQIDEIMSRYGRLALVKGPVDGELALETDDELLATEIERFSSAAHFLIGRVGPTRFRVRELDRGEVKWALIRLGYPVEDRAGFRPAPPFPIRLRDPERFRVRDYQRDAARHFLGGGAEHMGHGVIVLPCGAGKTVVGLAVMAELSQPTLILATSTAAVHQWIAEIRDKTEIPADQVGEYTGARKRIRPVTVATYHVLSHRRRDDPKDFPHIRRLSEESWGLVIYDEVHLLPAPLFRFTAAIQGTRRLGLTATLVREDAREDDVFSLVGPKRYDLPWRQLENRRYIAEAHCREIRIALPDPVRLEYAQADPRAQFRIAAENPRKIPIIDEIAAAHDSESVLVIGQYLRQLREIATRLDAPLLTGETPPAERERLYDCFRAGVFPILVVSRVANFAIDLPQASVAIQVSGTFGSRQEEAQRLGRVLRPKDRPSFFYTIVSRDTIEQEYAWKRQRFLTEQGYHYDVEDREIAPEPRAAN